MTGDQTWVASDDWNLSVRGEQPQQRADRNFVELLQELRVLQTGVQVLFALLLTVAFTGSFTEADGFERVVYVSALVCCAGATALLTAPVAFHRRLFQRDRKADVVQAAHRLLQVGMLVLLLAVVGALLLVVDHAVGRVPGLLVSSLVGAVFVLLWFVLPMWSTRSRGG
jgi:O-antigen/teichoic acid export membrane protein